MKRASFGRRIALGVATLAMIVSAAQAGTATPSVGAQQHVGMVWTNYPGGFFSLNLYPTVGNNNGGPLSYWFDGVVYSQGGCPQTFDYAYGRGKGVFVAEPTGTAGEGTLTGLANSSCGSRTYKITFSYTGTGSFRVIYGKPGLHYDYVIVQRDIRATGTFCWIGGTSACTAFGVATSAGLTTSLVTFA